MRGSTVVSWVLTVSSPFLRLSQAKTLAEVVAGALWVERVSLAAIGRRMRSGPKKAKHRIKRVWRFITNVRVHPADAMEGFIERLVRRRKKALLVAADWTDIRGFSTLMIAAVMKGRSLPLVWGSYARGTLRKSQNAVEEAALALLRSRVPSHVRIILLADRGFGRTDLARYCQAIGIRYLIRIKPKVVVRHRKCQGCLSTVPVAKGQAFVLKHAWFRKQNPVQQHVVVCWQKGLPAKRDEPWYLMTDLDRPARTLVALYAKRMTIEELFRDLKSVRNGFALRQTLVTTADRLDRLLLILVLVYWLLAGIGLRGRQRFSAAMWMSNNRTSDGSFVFIGRFLLLVFHWSPSHLVLLLAEATRAATPNWG